MATTANVILPISRKALAQARRVLDALPSKAMSLEAYRDHVPWALDRLLNVWRTIDNESSGRRTHAFGAWWAEQRGGNHDSVRRLRNIEVKENAQTTRGTQLFRASHTIHVHKDGRITT